MKILVTGGAGFIGSFITDALVKCGHTVRIFDNLDPQVHHNSTLPPYLNPEAEYVNGDVRDREALAAVVGDVEVVFHKAAAVGVGQSQYRIKHYVDVNIGGTANLLDVLANESHSVGKIIVAASMSSYGEGLYTCAQHGPSRPGMRLVDAVLDQGWEPRCVACDQPLEPRPISEDEPYHAMSIYGITKATQEEMVLSFGRTYRVPTVALRYFNVYGPRQSLSNPYTGVLAIFLSRLKNQNPPLVYEDGLQSRDFISIHDIVRANLLAMESSAADYQAFNVGVGDPLSIRSVAEGLADLLDLPIAPTILQQFRPGDVRHCFADITRIRKALHFEPQVKFLDGVRELVEWSKDEVAVDKFDAMTEDLKLRGLTG